jgi:hypothetical protein
MQDRVLPKVCVGFMFLMFLLALVKGHRAGKSFKESLSGFSSSGALFFAQVPFAFDLQALAATPFVVTAVALLAVSFRRLGSSADRPERPSSDGLR